MNIDYSPPAQAAGRWVYPAFRFGSESNDVDILKNLASTILYNKEYDKLVKNYLDLGNNYPSSISKALYNLTGVKLKNSNDLLGLSYIKTIFLNDYKIKPLTIKRTNSYLDQNLTNNISSATSIRIAYLNNENIKPYIPKETLNLLNIDKNYLDNYFNLLKYKLINEINELDKYLDVKEGIDKRIKKVILDVHSYQELLDKIKTKRYTYNKLNRMFNHILCGFTKEEAKKFTEIEYIRILGFNMKGKQYLNKIKKDVEIPIITKFSDLKSDMLDVEFRSTCVYASVLNEKDKIELIESEYKNSPIIR